nr:MAG TPA: hypothetical protein [Caudoviricetes sp.]
MIITCNDGRWALKSPAFARLIRCDSLVSFVFFDYHFLWSHLLDSTTDAIWDYRPRNAHCCTSSLLRRTNSTEHPDNSLHKPNNSANNAYNPEKFHYQNSFYQRATMINP